jgi:hypothetical protein
MYYWLVRQLLRPIRRRENLTRSPVAILLGNRMTDPKSEAPKMFKQEQPISTMSEYEREQLTIPKNREQLKAERLAREAKI